VAWKPNVDIPSLLKNKTLEEMINEWTSQIDADIYQFTQMAMLVGEWDKKVSSNSKKILELKQKVDMVEQAQSELNKNLELISSQQAQLSSVLSTLEASVEKWSLTVDLGPQDAERERGYVLADDIDVQLNQMSHKLKEMIDRLNASQERQSAKDGDHPAFQILQILDSHLNSLAWIDNTSTELGTKLADLNTSFQPRRSSKSSSTMDAYPSSSYAWGSRYH
jgi:nuclear pore complex protein Nup62